MAGKIRAAVAGMPNNKSPGIDGLPVEFYKRFWHVLGDILLDVYKEAHSLGRISGSQFTGLICLIFKQADRADLRNLRPIFLLTVDYKISSKALVKRLSPLLPTMDFAGCCRLL
jgi:hypothetical protein